ncbi:MAG: tripartite tricarboxylate transporter TctB family protein [Pseudomonadota bacterium]
MSPLADRCSGLFLVLCSLALFFWIIPTYTEVRDGGWLSPTTIPNSIAALLMVCGILITLRPTDHVPPHWQEFARAGLYAGVLAAGLWATSWVGFVYTAPVIAFVLMVLIGERRWPWLGLGCVVAPVVIWIVVVYVLQRPLP